LRLCLMVRNKLISVRSLHYIRRGRLMIFSGDGITGTIGYYIGEERDSYLCH
jgi:hypothetical protein